MSWRKALPYFEGDNRLQSIPDREREDIYEDFMDHLEKELKVIFKKRRT